MTVATERRDRRPSAAVRTSRSARCSRELRDEFPDVTISKIRFLESQGLIDPERTPSGYRKFYDGDLDRLRWILLPAEGALPAAQGDQGAPRRAPSGRPTCSSPRRLAVDAASEPTVPQPRPATSRPPTPHPLPFDRARRRAPRPTTSPTRAPRRADRRDRARDEAPTTTTLTTTRRARSSAAGLDRRRSSTSSRSFGLLDPGREIGRARALRRRRARDRAAGRRLLRARHRGAPPAHVPHFAEREAVLFGQVLLPYVRQRNPERAGAAAGGARGAGPPRAAAAHRAAARRACARRSPSDATPAHAGDPARRARDLAALRRRARGARSRPTIPTAWCSSACSRARCLPRRPRARDPATSTVMRRLPRDLALRARLGPGAHPPGPRPRPRTGATSCSSRTSSTPASRSRTSLEHVVRAGPRSRRRVHAARPTRAGGSCRSTVRYVGARDPPTCSCSGTGCTSPTCTATCRSCVEADRERRSPPTRGAYVDAATDGGPRSAGSGREGGGRARC